MPAQVSQGAAGQIDRGWVDKHVKLVADTGDLGREPVYQELHRSVQPSLVSTLTQTSGWKGLTLGRHRLGAVRTAAFDGSPGVVGLGWSPTDYHPLACVEQMDRVAVPELER